MKKRNLLLVDLCLFDGEGAAPAAGDAAGAGVQTSDAGKDRAGSEGTNEQQDAAGAVVQEDAETRKAEYRSLIAEKYKDLYDEDVQKIVKGRVKEYRTLEQKTNKLQVLADNLAAKYGIRDAEDLDGILKALDADEGFYEQAAAEEGLTVEQYKHMRQMEQENRQLRKAKEEAEKRQQADKVYAGWLQEAEQLKSTYPGFDLQEELMNPQFGKMLSLGVGVKAAFQALHHDEIMAGAMQHTAQTIAKKTADAVASRQARPAENGINSQASAAVATDVSKMTRAERREAARRAARGEMVTFR